MRRTYVYLVIGAFGGPLACGDGGGDMNPPQESVSDGQMPLSSGIDVAVEAGFGVFGLTSNDGWTIEYTRFLVTFGAIEFTQADGSTIEHEELGVVDVLGIETRRRLATVEVTVGSTEVRFSMPAATSGFTPIAPASVIDRDMMAKSGYSVYVEGTISQKGGLACVPGSPTLCTPAPSVAFKLGVPIDRMFEDCPQVDVVADEYVDQTLTLSGDLWFRTDFKAPGAAAPMVRAQWLANADTNRDGEVTLEELAQIKASLLFDARLGYDTRTGAPFVIDTAADFFTAQALMIGRDALGGCASLSTL